MTAPPPIRSVKANWGGAVLVCRKCSKKVGAVFGPDGDERLARALRRRAGLRKGRKAAAGVVEVGCLGLCPKGAVTVVNTARPDEWLMVPPGTPMTDLAVRLGLPAGGEGKKDGEVSEDGGA